MINLRGKRRRLRPLRGWLRCGGRLFGVRGRSWVCLGGPVGLVSERQELLWRFRELADALVKYCHEMGYTHLELLPISEHPLDESWGYQPIGLFAPTRRFGEPAGFARFVDRAHAVGLGVILLATSYLFHRFRSLIFEQER